jgi:predicted nucleic acid-binding protein
MTLSHGPRVVIVDASAMVEVVVGDPAWTQRLSEWQEAGAMLFVPPHFGIEVANALLRGLRLDAHDVAARLGELFRAGVEVADRGLIGLADAIELAAGHSLSVSDAAYLALALELEGELATRDHALARAAGAEGLVVIA